jgi:CBS domain containing-hemolysin-like protein
MWAITAVLFVIGITLALGQSAIENFSWKALLERLKDADQEAQFRWLGDDGYELARRTLQWTRLAVYLFVAAGLERLLLPAGAAWILGFAGIVLAILVFGEAMPRLVGHYNAEAALIRLRPLLRGVIQATRPLAITLGWLPTAIARLSGHNLETFHQEKRTAEISDAAEEGERSGVLEEEERAMIENIIDLGETEAVEVMTPRTDLVSIDCEATIPTARQVATESGHSRIPVYEGNRDQIIGILHVKDLLRAEKDDDTIRSFIRQPHFIPETKDLSELLKEFKERKIHIAIVLDEYGGTSGLITMEDILEEIVGEITDEFDDQNEPTTIRQVDAHTIRVDAKVHVHELNERLDLHLPDDVGYETLGGFVFSTLGRVPEAGETFRHNGAEFRILEADPRRVNRVQITVAPPEDA